MSQHGEPYIPVPRDLDLPPREPEEIGGIAGFWRWKPTGNQAHRQQVRASKRLASPKTPLARTPLMGLCNELWPWDVWNYPGKTRMLAHIMACERGTAGQWAKGAYMPGVEASARLVAWIRAKAGRLEAIALEIERASAGKMKGRRPGRATIARSEAGGLLKSVGVTGLRGGGQFQPADTLAEGIHPQAAPCQTLPVGAQPLGHGRDGQRHVPFLAPKD
jgi:hypothetical protein